MYLIRKNLVSRRVFFVLFLVGISIINSTLYADTSQIFALNADSTNCNCPEDSIISDRRDCVSHQNHIPGSSKNPKLRLTCRTFKKIPVQTCIYKSMSVPTCLIINMGEVYPHCIGTLQQEKGSKSNDPNQIKCELLKKKIPNEIQNQTEMVDAIGQIINSEDYGYRNILACRPVYDDGGRAVSCRALFATEGPAEFCEPSYDTGDRLHNILGMWLGQGYGKKKIQDCQPEYQDTCEDKTCQYGFTSFRFDKGRDGKYLRSGKCEVFLEDLPVACSKEKTLEREVPQDLNL